VHVGVVIDLVGRTLGTRSVPTTQAGHDELEQWATSFGPLLRAGIEGACAYGAGLARHLAGQGHEVVEVARPDRRVRRREGKHDTIDAREAARAALAGEGTVPKSGQGQVEMIGALRVVRRSAAQARGVAANQLHSLLVTAPQPVRDQLRGLPLARLVAAAAAFGDGQLDNVEAAVRLALPELAVPHQALTEQIRRLDRDLDRLTEQAAPTLRALHGVGPEVAATLLVTVGDNADRLHSDAALARVCGAAPLPASSGKTTRHRLNRGGDRHANQALWRIVMVRLRWHAPTRAYIQRRTAEGKTTAEIIRCLKRYVVREVYTAVRADLALSP